MVPNSWLGPTQLLLPKFTKESAMSNLIHKNETGFVLPMGLMFLVIILLLGAIATFITTTDTKIGGNYKSSVEAFCDAEAGIQYAIAKIDDGLKADPQIFTFPTTIGTSSPLSYTVPTDFSFVISGISLTGSNTYSFRSTGHSANASSTVEVVLVRGPVFQYGAFGNTTLDMKASGTVYSYNSSVNPNSDPLPEDSTGDGDIGCNGEVVVYDGTYIDGDVGLGDDGGDPVIEAVYKELPTPTIIGEVADVPRVDPDPMGAIGGDLAADFVTYSTTNDNASAGITDNTISLGNGETLTLTAGNYYMTSIELGNGSILNIDAGSGEVNIYLAGGLHADNDSSINVTGTPPDLTIFSNSTDGMDFSNNTIFKGTVYAPYATVMMKNDADVYGMIWANEVYMKNSGAFYFDTALQDKWLADTFDIVSWKEVLN